MVQHSKRKLPSNLSSPNAAAPFTSPNKQIHLWLSPTRLVKDSKSQLRPQNIRGYHIRDADEQLRGYQITNSMLERFRANWHDNATNTSNYRIRFSI